MERPADDIRAKNTDVFLERRTSSRQSAEAAGHVPFSSRGLHFMGRTKVP
jgi:hypothetical protein